MPEQEISKEVKIEVIADLLKHSLELIVKNTGVNVEILLPIMQKLNNNNDEEITMDYVYTMAAKGLYDRIYEPSFVGCLILAPRCDGKKLPELQQKWNINKDKEEEEEEE